MAPCYEEWRSRQGTLPTDGWLAFSPSSFGRFAGSIFHRSARTVAKPTDSQQPEGGNNTNSVGRSVGRSEGGTKEQAELVNRISQTRIGCCLSWLRAKKKSTLVGFVLTLLSSFWPKRQRGRKCTNECTIRLLLRSESWQMGADRISHSL